MNGFQYKQYNRKTYILIWTNIIIFQWTLDWPNRKTQAMQTEPVPGETSHMLFSANNTESC